MFQDIVRKRSADKYSVAPFLCGLLSSTLWTIYGSQLVADSASVMIGSALGVISNGAYCLIYYSFSESSRVSCASHGICAIY